ncbi:Signal recognition particle receptor subunit alpha [Nosema bombycis CQ1]|uniref:Signal recognition particle receptor subunit alpha homolog n=1 Tax=Nosema bombycis (strain CQ1 / CVCC 102059) TaxID=578461 RepID=R0KX74_NOSB1|nr:Signal recognition particle receptor subunit alpha [Nosema bombycis CQ1]|eukprot:EOB15491.1 Signal recognition particle receptor subunit alpha [Nosema bombycis CQ1]
MPYFCVFNKKGWLLQEEGIPPSYLNSVISSIDLSTLSGSRIVRDDKVEYEIRGPIIYLSVGGRKTLKEMIQDKNEVKKEVKKEVIKKDVKIDNSLQEIINPLDYSIRSSLSVSPSLTPTHSSFNSKFMRKFNLFSKEISVSDLRNKMELHLVKKNVDYNTTKILTDCVINELKEENLEFVTPDLFKKLMGSVLKKIIPSVNHENLLKEIKNENKKGNIFSLCFVGVNGVGKSTSLSKVCYWFLQKGLRVYIAACDTFRAGAVEQLKVHVQRFRESNYDVGFYEKGYGKDDASVARTAILNATKENYDVILIDTAGRMHNKKTLMDSLSKLIKINNPNHIVYVGEALVGTDSLIHIEEFNKAIGKGMENRRINSIILTKVDTVDEKIGQILNMTFSSNSPVLFLGTGQTNSDLTKIDSEEIINVLMS